jgi:hypothetical protein
MFQKLNGRLPSMAVHLTQINLETPTKGQQTYGERENMSDNQRFLDPPTSAHVHGMKRCARRGCIKPLSAFNVSKKKPDGRQPYCRACQDDDHLLRSYTLTCQQRDLMFDQQQGQCASCQTGYPQLYIYAFKGLGVIRLVCPRCMRMLNGFNRNPAIVESAIGYLDYFGSRVLYGVERHVNEDWEATPPGEPPRKSHRRQYRRGVKPETYDHWS